jgi:hypothetical protein
VIVLVPRFSADPTPMIFDNVLIQFRVGFWFFLNYEGVVKQMIKRNNI